LATRADFRRYAETLQHCSRVGIEGFRLQHANLAG
jgi:hypothetical protein